MNTDRLHYLLGQQERTLAAIRMILSKEAGYISTTSVTLIRGLLDLAPTAEIELPPEEAPTEEEHL